MRNFTKMSIFAVFLLLIGQTGLRAQNCSVTAIATGCSCEPHEWFSPTAILDATYSGPGVVVTGDTTYFWNGPNFASPGKQVYAPYPGAYNVTVVVKDAVTGDTLCETTDQVVVEQCNPGECQGDNVLHVGETFVSPTLSYATGGQLQELEVLLDPCIVAGDTIIVTTTPDCLADGTTGRFDNGQQIAPYIHVGEGGWCYSCSCNASMAFSEQMCTRPGVFLMDNGFTVIQECSGGSTAKFLFPVHGNPTKFTIMVRLSSDLGTIVNYTASVKPGQNKLKLEIPQLDVCLGSTDTLVVVATGGSEPYSFAWSNGSIDSVVMVGAGTHTVTVTDANGCSESKNTTIGTMNIDVDLVEAQGCGSSSITATADGEAPFNFIWSTGQSGETIDGLNSGNYSVTVTDANGCSASNTTTIIVPEAMTVSVFWGDILCHGGSTVANAEVSGGTTPYSYSWSNGENSPTTSVTAGDYAVTVTDSIGCQATMSFVVEQPDSLWMALIYQEPSCWSGTDAQVVSGPEGGTEPWTYQWSNGGQEQFVHGPAGNYSVTVTDANGCTIQDSILVTQPTQLQVTLSELKPSCYGDDDGELTVEATGATPDYGYLWNTGWSQATLPNVPTGSYSVTVTDANGCSKELTNYLEQPDSLIVSLEFQEASCEGIADGTAEVTVYGGTPNFIYDWSNGQTSREIDEILAGEYFVTVTDANGCKVLGSITIEASEPDQVYFPNVFSPNGDGINDVFYPQSGECVKGVITFIVFDRWGNQVFEKHNFQPNQPGEGWDGSFRSKKMQPGVYAWFAEVEYYSGEVKLVKGDIQLIN